MSFGFSISDVINIVQIGQKTYRDWKDAPAEYAVIDDHLNSLQCILRRLRQETNTSNSLLTADGEDAHQLANILRSSGQTVQQLNDVVKKYESLAKARKRTSDRLTFPIERLKDLRSKLAYSITTLSGFLDIVAVSALARVEQGIQGLPQITQAINHLAAEVRSGRRECSVMTIYDNDDRAVWREFRKELIGSGFRSDVIQRHKTKIRRYLTDLQSAGRLEEEQPASPNSELVGWRPIQTQNENSQETIERPLSTRQDATHQPSTNATSLNVYLTNQESSTIEPQPTFPVASSQDKLFTTPAEQWSKETAQSSSPQTQGHKFVGTSLRWNDLDEESDTSSESGSEHNPFPEGTYESLSKEFGYSNGARIGGSRAPPDRAEFKFQPDYDGGLPNTFEGLKKLFGQYYAEPKMSMNNSEKAEYEYSSKQHLRSRSELRPAQRIDLIYEPSDPIRLLERFVEDNGVGSDAEDGIFEMSTGLKDALMFYVNEDEAASWRLDRLKQKEEQEREEKRRALEKLLERTDWGDGFTIEDITEVKKPTRPDSGYGSFHFSDPVDVYARFLREQGGVASVEVEDDAILSDSSIS